MESIIVGGPPGSGTSTVCRLIQKELDIPYIYAGQIFRDKAKALELTLSQFGDLCEEDPRYDKELDDEMMEIAKGKDVLIEGRMIGPLCSEKGIPSFRIYIDADPMTRAERVMERDGGSIEEVMEKMRDREESEAERYLRYYNIDHRDPSYYDLIIDSSDITPEEELALIMEKLGKEEK